MEQMRSSSSGSELLTLHRWDGIGIPAEAAVAAASPKMNRCSPLSDDSVVPPQLQKSKVFLFGLRENSTATETAPILLLHRGWHAHLLNEGIMWRRSILIWGTINLVHSSHSWPPFMSLPVFCHVDACKGKQVISHPGFGEL